MAQPVPFADLSVEDDPFSTAVDRLRRPVQAVIRGEAVEYVPERTGTPIALTEEEITAILNESRSRLRESWNKTYPTHPFKE